MKLPIAEEEIERLNLLIGYAQVVATLANSLQYMNNHAEVATKICGELVAVIDEMADTREAATEK